MVRTNAVVLRHLEWSHERDDKANVIQQRYTTCTFLELTCAVDILTGGSCGPKDASFRDKLEICKKIWAAAACQFQTKKKIRTANDRPTTAPLGFDKMRGLNRRPNFGKWPGTRRKAKTD